MPPKPPHPTIVLTEFDEKTIGQSTQMLKALIPFLEPEQQRMFGLMVRIMEFNMTLDYFNRHRIAACAFTPRCKQDMLSELKNYCSPEERKQLDMMLGMIKASQLQAAFAQASEQPNDGDDCCKDDCKDNPPGPKDRPKRAGPSPLDMLSGFLTPEQLKLCRQYEDML